MKKSCFILLEDHCERVNYCGPHTKWVKVDYDIEHPPRIGEHIQFDCYTPDYQSCEDCSTNYLEVLNIVKSEHIAEITGIDPITDLKGIPTYDYNKLSWLLINKGLLGLESFAQPEFEYHFKPTALDAFAMSYIIPLISDYFPKVTIKLVNLDVEGKRNEFIVETRKNQKNTNKTIDKSSELSDRLERLEEFMWKFIQEPHAKQSINVNNSELSIKSYKKVFISYAKEDYNSAIKIYNELEKLEGITPWIDRKSLLPGQQWKFAIKNAISNSHFFIALISNNSVTKDGYVQKELNEALEMLDRKPATKVYIIPARLDECYPEHPKLQDLHWVDLFKSWDEGLLEIINVLNS